MAGIVVRDVYKNLWSLSTPIGQGGFGVIYIGKNKFRFIVRVFKNLMPEIDLIKKQIGARTNPKTLTVPNML